MMFILGSSSPYRQSILEKTRIPFSCHSPNIDETRLENESAKDLVIRLAIKKAEAIAKDKMDAWIITSDQVACFNEEIIGKPHSKDNAINQLCKFSGQHVRFLTSLCITHPATQRQTVELETFDVHFRTLCNKTIDRYLDLEEPYNCAGSFKSEGLGILLFEKLEGRDPNSLVGLPLILLQELFTQFGVDLLDYSK